MTAFLLDGMLVGLARRLRMLGYDCRLIGANTRGEKAILALACTEDRLVLTVSACRAAYAPDHFILLPKGNADAQIRAIALRFPIDFKRRAFTRCSLDNALLDEVDFTSVADRLPPQVCELAPSPIRHCPLCDRLYWQGTHSQRLWESFRRLGILIN